MGECEPTMQPATPIEGADIFAGKRRISLGEVRDSFGFEPGTQEYLHISGWLQLEMGETLQLATDKDFAFQVDERKARALRASVQESLEMINDPLDLTPDEEDLVVSLSPLAPKPPSDEILPSKQPERKEATEHPELKKLVEGEDTVISQEPIRQNGFSVSEILERAGIERGLRNRLKIKNTALRMGFDIIDDRYQIPPQMLDLFLNTINPDRTRPKRRK